MCVAVPAVAVAVGEPSPNCHVYSSVAWSMLLGSVAVPANDTALPDGLLTFPPASTDGASFATVTTNDAVSLRAPSVAVTVPVYVPSSANVWFGCAPSALPPSENSQCNDGLPQPTV